ncbi:Protein of unknown function DUF2625 [Chitinophaga sp. YR627]|uniref:DUF2625 domain-containing protein n=1 Tax=Chitinophaga sp. YR627 TaxID=1881041 RepID=UPI0008F04B5D|nr:DUF2625 domain-containing protein [Chitinophaga sp. YR627]SFM73849.1 Protein of unknown function DUF2625 [Chitinophaga sp. YR627]
MKNLFLILVITFFSANIFAQRQMKNIEDLINTKEPGWDLVQEWIGKAKNKVEILPCDTAKAKAALYQTQVTTRSPMGAIIYATGGLLIDHGWIRILGSGHARLNRSLPEWNLGKSFKETGEVPQFLLIADDAAGGFFAVNGGALGPDPGKVYYLAPDNLDREALDLSYSDFLSFCFNGDLADFYKTLRWNQWEEEVARLDGNETYNFLPMLFTKEGKDINKVSRKAVPVQEQYEMNMSFREQLGIGK